MKLTLQKNMAFLSLLLIAGVKANAQIYVTPTGSGSMDGTSWSNAYNGNDTTTTVGYSQLQVLLKTLQPSQIWVGGGTYKIEKSSQTTNTERTFTIANGQVVYGGFYGTAGTEGQLSQRDTTNTTNPSILNNLNAVGAANGVGDYSSVVKMVGISGTPITASTILDGFTISNGKNGVYLSGGPIAVGAGFYLSFASPTLKHLLVTNNSATNPNNGCHAGGIYLSNGSHPIISYSKFVSNTAISGGVGGAIGITNTTNTGVVTFIKDTFITNTSGTGGAIQSDDSLHIEDCYFSGNTSSGTTGGAIVGTNGGTTASLYIKKSVFFSSSTTTNGGAIYWGSDLPTITIDSCKFDGNTAVTSGGAIDIAPSTGPYLLNVTNSQFLNNSATVSGGAVTINLGGNTTGSAGYFKNNVFYNDFGGIGGGIYATGTGKMTIYGANLVFDSCSVTAAGGYSNGTALHLLSSAGATVTSSIFTNCTFAKNFNGNVIYLSNATGHIDTIHNCIFLGNKNYISGGSTGITNTNSDFMTVGYTTTSLNKIYISNSLFDTTRLTTTSNGKVIPLISAGGNNITHPDTAVSNTFLSQNNGPGADGIWMTADDGLHELTTAQTVDMGSNTFVGTVSGFSSIPTDITPTSLRILGSSVDMGAYEGPGTVLSIVMLNFTGNLQYGFAKLQWQTGIESRFDHFELESSKDAETFETVANIAAKGNNSRYDYTIAQSIPTAYYRLKNVDQDGAFTYSQIIKLSQSVDQKLMVYPNPAQTSLFVSVSSPISFKIFDGAGHLVKTNLLQSGANKIDISDIKPGTYFGITATGSKVTFVKD